MIFEVDVYGDVHIDIYKYSCISTETLIPGNYLISLIH